MQDLSSFTLVIPLYAIEGLFESQESGLGLGQGWVWGWTTGVCYLHLVPCGTKMFR